MSRPHDAQVTAVERQDHHHLEAFGGGHERCIDRAEREIAVPPDQLGDSQPVRFVHPLDEKLARGERAEEASFRSRAEAVPDQMSDLRDDEYRDEPRSRGVLECFQALRVASVVRVRDGIEGPGVDEYGYRPASSLRISSTRSEMSLRPLWPTAAKLSLPFSPRYRSSASRVISEIVRPLRFAS